MGDTKKKRRFRLFDSQREGRGISKDDVYTKPDLKGFFIKYKLYFTRLLSVNILMILGNFPLIFAAIAMSSLTRILYETPVMESFPVLRGLMLQQTEPGAATLVTAAIEGMQTETSAMTVWTYVLFGLSALTLFTFGITNAGTTYVLRNMIKGDPVFLPSDFFYAVKRNWKQAFPLGILDGILLLLIPFNIAFLSSSMSSSLSAILLGATLVISLLYIFMRFYMYLQMVTFDLPIRKILKNSLIFCLIGFKRNFLALLGILLLVFIDLLLFFSFGGIFMPLAIMLPLVLLFSNGAFMACYAAYYKMKEIMIDPYTSAPSEEGAEEEETEEESESATDDGDAPAESSDELPE